VAGFNVGGFMEKPKVVILCGGMGTRLKEETEFKPKPLVMVGNRPILWHIMKIYSHYGFNDFVLCLGYKGDMIKQYFRDYEFNAYDFELNLKTQKHKLLSAKDIPDWNIIFANTGMNANTGARLKKIEKYIDGSTFFMTYGDGVSDVNIPETLKFHKAHGKIGTVTTVRPTIRFGNLNINANNQITDFTKKATIHEGWIDGGFFVFNKGIFNYLNEDDSCMLENAPLQNLSRDGQFMCYKHSGYWQCMDTFKDYEQLNEVWNSGKAPWKLWDRQL